MLTTAHLDDEFSSLKRIATQDGRSVGETILRHLDTLRGNGARPAYLLVIMQEMVKRMDAEAATSGWQMQVSGTDDTFVSRNRVL